MVKRKQNFIPQCFFELRSKLLKWLTPRCTLVKNRGGVKGTIRWLSSRLKDYKFVARFDIASYYNSINHSQLLDLVKKEIGSDYLYDIVKNYIQMPDYLNT